MQTGDWVLPLQRGAAGFFGKQFHDCGTAGVPGIHGPIAELVPQEFVDRWGRSFPADLQFPRLSPSHGQDDAGGSWQA